MKHAGGSPTEAPAVGEKGLKRDAIGYLSNLVIGIAETAPAYSLAATLGFIVAVAGVGVHAPAVLIVAFLPILCVAFGFRYLNRANPDAGITFAWVTRAMGPQLGWINGWAIFAAGIIVMASVSVIAAKYTFLLFGLTAAANSNLALIIAAVVWIVLMTAISYRGIELSARVQQVLLGTELAILSLFAVVALIKVYANHPPGSLTPQLSWFDPFALSFSALIDALLLAIFMYWGWDGSMSVAEESRNNKTAPGRAAVMATLLLVVTYVLVSTAGQAFGGTHLITSNSSDVLSVLGTKAFGSPLDKLFTLAVLSSCVSGTQLTIIPTSRLALSMAHWEAIPRVFGRVHPRFRTPTVSTLGMSAVSIVWTVVLLAVNPSQNVLGDAVTACCFNVCFYYGFTGLACTVYYRRQLLDSPRSLVTLGLLPAIGGLAMIAIGVKAFTYYSQAGVNYSKPLLGIQTPILVGIGGLLLGAVPLLACWIRFPGYFRRRPEVADQGVLTPLAPSPPSARSRLQEHPGHTGARPPLLGESEATTSGSADVV